MTAGIILFSLLSLLFNSQEADIVFAGDAMMHTAQTEAARRENGSFDFSEYFSAIDDYVTMADYAVVNLETPVAGPPFSGYPCFNAPDGFVDALADAGFDLFLTANNHTLDRHDRGLIATAALLDSLHLDHIGTYPSSTARSGALPFVKDINGMKVGFINYTYGTNGIKPGKNVVVDYINRETILSDVEAAKAAGAELLIACIHWGIEYKMVQNKDQESLAAWLHSIGVDAVIGGHPHVVQPMQLDFSEPPNPRLTVYSLGNFISNMRTTDTRGGALLKMKIGRDDDGKVRIRDASYRLVFTEPANSDHNFRLRWADVSSDNRAALFARSARAIFNRHNENVAEDHPHKAVHFSHACADSGQ